MAQMKADSQGLEGSTPKPSVVSLGPQSPASATPRSEINRLKAVVAVKDACLMNFSKTLREAEEKHKTKAQTLTSRIEQLELSLSQTQSGSLATSQVSNNDEGASTKRLEQAEAEIARHKKELSVERDEHNMLRSVHEEMVRISKSTEESLSNECRQKSQELIEAKDRILEAQAKMRDMDAESQQKVLTLEQKLVENNSNSQNNVEDLRQRLLLIENENAILRKTETESTTGTEAWKSRAIQAELLLERIRSDAESEVRRLTDQHRISIEAARQNSNLHITELKSKIEHMGKELSHTRQSLQDEQRRNDERERETRHYEEHLISNRNELHQLRDSTIVEMEHLRQTLQIRDKQLRVLEARGLGAEERNKELENELVKARGDLEQATNHIRHLDGLVQSARTKEIQLKDGSSAEKTAKDIEMMEMRGVVTSLERKLSDQASIVVGAKERALHSEKQCMELDDMLRDAQHKKTEIQVRVEFLEGDLKQAHAELARLRGRSSMQGQNEMDAASATHRLNALRDEYGRMQAKLEAEIRVLQRKLEQQEGHNEALNQVFSQGSMGSEAPGEAERLRIQLRQKDIEIVGLKEELQHLTQIMEEGKRDMMDLLVEVEKKDHEIRDLRTSAFAQNASRGLGASVVSKDLLGITPSKVQDIAVFRELPATDYPYPPSTGGSMAIEKATRFVQIGETNVEDASLEEVRAALEGAVDKPVDVVLRKATGEICRVRARNPHKLLEMGLGGFGGSRGQGSGIQGVEGFEDSRLYTSNPTSPNLSISASMV